MYGAMSWPDEEKQNMLVQNIMLMDFTQQSQITNTHENKIDK